MIKERPVHSEWMRNFLPHNHSFLNFNNDKVFKIMDVKFASRIKNNKKAVIPVTFSPQVKAKLESR